MINLKKLHQNTLLIENKLMIIVKKSFVEIAGMERNKDIKIAAALIIYERDYLLTAPKDQRVRDEDQDNHLNDVWARFMRLNWISYDKRSDRLHIAFKSAGNDLTDQFISDRILNALGNPETKGCKIAEGKSLNVPSSRRLDYGYIKIEKASQKFTRPSEDAVLLLRRIPIKKDY